MEILSSQFVKAYNHPQDPQPRKEAAPLPLSFVVWMERMVLDTNKDVKLRFLCGSFLVCVWSSLRFSDLQWCEPSNIHADPGLIRGMAVRTRGMSFAFISSDFLGHTVSVSWAMLWHGLLMDALRSTLLANPHADPDFILPQMHDDSTVQLLSPMSRSQALIALRSLLAGHYEEAGVPLHSVLFSDLGVRSMKVTLLA